MIELEEIILKCAEFGVLGVIVLILLTRGITALNSLTQSQTALTESTNRLYDKVVVMDSRIGVIEGRLTAIESALGEIKNFLQYRFLKPDVVDR